MAKNQQHRDAPDILDSIDLTLLAPEVDLDNLRELVRELRLSMGLKRHVFG